MMRAISTASGGVMFIPDELERKVSASNISDPISYRDLVEDEKPSLPGMVLKNLKTVVSKLGMDKSAQNADVA